MQPRSVIITGAGSGIGAGIAQAFVTAGDRVFLVDVSEERAQKTAEGLGSDLVTARQGDVTDAEAMRDLVIQVCRETGSVDVLVSNAGVFDGCAGVQETSSALWDRVIGINLTGTFNIVKPVAEAMISQRGGRIISIGSIAAQRALPDGLAYCASKAALEGMVRRLAFDLGQYDITTNLVAPGVIRSSIRANSEEILGDLVPDVNVGVGTNDDLMNMLVPARRAGEPSDIAATVLFLASAGAGYINGEVIHVDGGWIAS
jgi:3-oxoacyl-[acyl-carrier protein] reductase